MPSIFNTALDGLSKAITANPANKTSTVARSAGSTPAAPNTVNTPVARPSVFTGSSNDWIDADLISSTGVVGLTVGFCSGTSVGAVDEVRKSVEVTVANANLANSDPTHDKTYDRVVMTTGYRQLVDGRWVDVNGTVVTSFTSITGQFTTSDEVTKSMYQAPQDYNYRMGLTNTDKNLPNRTQ